MRGLLAGARRHGYPLTVLLLGVDHVKTVNDIVGHASGDDVLVTVSQRLTPALRAEDRVGR